MSLAHAGFLFLDDLPLYRPELIEALRQPLDRGEIASRGPGLDRLPARFGLIAALNPCPCGSFGDPEGRCRCSVNALLRYRAVLSLPWLDRIDLRVQVVRPFGDPARPPSFEPDGSEAAAGRIARARALQMERFGSESAAPFNAAMRNREVLAHCPLDGRAEEIAKVFYNRLGTSTRAWFALLRVARTIADLEGRAVIDGHAIAEAIQYRWWAGLGREDSRLD